MSRTFITILLVAQLAMLPVVHAADGLSTVKSPYPVDMTIDRLETAAKKLDLVVFAHRPRGRRAKDRPDAAAHHAIDIRQPAGRHAFHGVRAVGRDRSAVEGARMARTSRDRHGSVTTIRSTSRRAIT